MGKTGSTTDRCTSAVSAATAQAQRLGFALTGAATFSTMSERQHYGRVMQ